MHELPAPTLRALPVALVLGLACGLGGVVFNRCLLKSLDLFDRLRHWPAWAVGAMVGIGVGLAGWLYPGVAGSGAGLAERAVLGEIAVRWLLLILIARFFLTMWSYGSGAAGGIFAPLLVIGVGRPGGRTSRPQDRADVG